MLIDFSRIVRHAASGAAALALLAANAAHATAAPTEWCGKFLVDGVVYLDYCGYGALWHFDRFDLASNQWIATVPVGLHQSFAVGAPGLLVETNNGVVRSEPDGSNPTALANTMHGATAMGMDGRYLFLASYNNIQSYDLVTQQPATTLNSVFYAFPSTFIVDSVHDQLLGLIGSYPWRLSYGSDGTLAQSSGGNRFVLPFTTGPRNYLAPDAATFANSGGAVFTTDNNMNEIGWLGGPFDDMAYTNGQIVVLRYDTLIRIDATSRAELGRFTLDHTYSDLVADGSDVVAFYSQNATAHSRRVPLAAIVPQTLPPAVSPMAHAWLASKVELDQAGRLYLLVGDDRVVHRYDLASNMYLASIALPETAATFTVDPATSRVYAGLRSAAVVDADPGATAAHPLLYSRQPVDAMTFIGGRLYTSESDNNWESHEVRDPISGAMLSSIDGRNRSTELVWSPVNRHVYYVTQNETPENIYWDSVDASGTITNTGQSSYFGSPLNALPPARVDPTGTYIVLGSGQMLDTATLTLAAQTLPDAPTDVAWIGSTPYAAVAAGNGVTTLRRYDSNFAVAASAVALGDPQRLFAYGNALVLVSTRNGATLITRVPADFSGSDYSTAAVAVPLPPAAAGQMAAVAFEFRNQGPAGPTASHLTIAPAVPVGVIDWTCNDGASTYACGSSATFDATPSLAAGTFLRVTGTFTVSAGTRGGLLFTANADAGAADPVSGNNGQTSQVLFDELFNGDFE